MEAIQAAPVHMTGKTEDLTGRRFGMLTVVRLQAQCGKRTWLCKCDCGGKIIVPTTRLTHGKVTHCGCIPKPRPRLIDLTGQRFGRLVVLRLAGKTAEGKILWECKCDCGNTTVVPSYSLRRGTTKSCGCLAKRTRQKTN